MSERTWEEAMMQSFWKTRSAVLALAIGIAGAGLITAPGAQAVPVLTPGSHSLQPGEERVFFTTFQTGMEITGTTSESHTPVVFLSDQILQASPNDR